MTNKPTPPRPVPPKKGGDRPPNPGGPKRGGDQPPSQQPPHGGGDQPPKGGGDQPPKGGGDQPPSPAPGDEFLDQIPPDLRDEIQALRKYESRVLEAMKDPKMNDLFLHNPKAFFAALKIPLPPGLNRRLKNQPVQHAFLQPRAFRLPTGQTISPKLNVRFSGSKPNDGKPNDGKPNDGKPEDK